MALIAFVLQLYELVVLSRVVLSWVQADPRHPVVRWIYTLTEPVLAPIRSIIPATRLGIDFSPIIVFILIGLIRRALFTGGFF